MGTVASSARDLRDLAVDEFEGSDLAAPPRSERRRWSTGLDEPALDVSLAARALGYLLAVTASVELISLTLFRLSSADRLRIVALSASAYGIVVLLIAARARIPAWSFPVTLAVSSLLISAAISFSNQSPSAYTFFYLWVVVYAFYFFTPWQATAQLALIAAGYAFVLSLQSQTFPPLENWTLTTGTLTLVGLAIGGLRMKLMRALAKLTDTASTDGLTGLMNRGALLKALGLELNRARRHEYPLTVVVVGIDDFAHINQVRGQEVGDRALRRLAATLADHTREGDSSGRMGGNRFGLVLPGTDTHGARVVADKLRKNVELLSPGNPDSFTISAGVAAFPADAKAPDVLLMAAERAWAVAKAIGGNRATVHHPDITAILAEVHRHDPGRDITVATLVTLAEALDIRDAGTARHSRTVGRYAQMIARGLDLPDAVIERLLLAGVLHDLGKIGISDSILRKAGPLTDHEWDEMREHPEIGARILEHADIDDIRGWVLSHHERPDGNGYPRGLRSHEISLGAKILAVADAYEAMTSDRPYRAAMTHEAAQAELRRCAGSHFDTKVVRVFLSALEEDVVVGSQTRNR